MPRDKSFSNHCLSQLDRDLSLSFVPYKETAPFDASDVKHGKQLCVAVSWFLMR